MHIYEAGDSSLTRIVQQFTCEEPPQGTEYRLVGELIKQTQAVLRQGVRVEFARIVEIDLAVVATNILKTMAANKCNGRYPKLLV